MKKIKVVRNYVQFLKILEFLNAKLCAIFEKFEIFGIPNGFHGIYLG